MRTFTSLLIGAIFTGSALIQAQEPTLPDPAPQTIIEEAALGSTTEGVDSAESSADTTEAKMEVLGPPAPPEDAESSDGADGGSTFRFDFHTPNGTYSGNTASYDPGRFVYEVHRNDGKGRFSFEGSFLQGFWFSPVMVMIRSGLLVLWVALGCATAAIFQPAIARTQAELRQAPGRSAALGFLWLISFWILLLFGVVMALVLIGLPFILVVLVFDLALRVFGLTVTFAIVGEWIARRMNRPGVSIYAAVFIGACALGLLRLVPVAGSFIWFAAALFGVGATLATRFGSATTPPALGYSSGPAPMAPMPA